MSMSPAPSGRLAALAATAAGITIAQQVAGKAARDALFLTHFPVTALPGMLIGAALLSVVAVLPASRALATHGPRRLVPAGFALGALIMALIALLGRRLPAAAAVALYLHVAVAGSLLISGFWSIVNEAFDPRAAKRQIGRIAAGGTLGGLLGGIAAERVSAVAGPAAVPLLLAGMLALAGTLTARLAASAPPTPAADIQPEAGLLEGVRMLSRVRYLRDVAWLVGLLTVMTALLDYVFKARAAQAYRDHELLRFFALFYVVTGGLAFLAQLALARRSLERLGLARTVAVLPTTAAAAAATAWVLPGFFAATVARGVESVLRHSLFRSGFELFFTPIPPREKRACKAVTDVGVERAGDAVGGGLVRLVLAVIPAVALPALTALAAGLGAAATFVALRLHRGYVEALEKNLALRAVRLGPDDAVDRTTRDTVLLSLSGIPLPVSASAFGAIGVAGLAGQAATLDDAQGQAIAALRSGNVERIRDVLSRPQLLEPAVAAHVVPLLARDDLVNDAASALRARSRRLCGQLVDALLDERQPTAVRRRLPRVLAACPTQRAVDGLLDGLDDRRFEVRFQCGRALARLQEQDPTLRIAPARVHEIVIREVQRGQGVWQGQRLWEARPTQPKPSPADALHARAGRTMQHLFTLLGLTMQRAPLMTAHQGLSSGDAAMRGTSLEYLETVLPAPVLAALAPLLDRDRPKPPARPPAQVLEDLLRSGASMQIDVAALRQAFRAEGRTGETPPPPPGAPPAGAESAPQSPEPPPRPPGPL